MAINLINYPYKKSIITENLEKLDIRRNSNNVTTMFNGKQISSNIVSDNYQVFDFKSFSNIIVDSIESYFKPERFNLQIKSGVQELRLIGEEVIVNGESYHKMFNVLSSSDKSRALQCNIGLIRFICSNGLVYAVDSEYNGLKVKHYKSKMDDSIQEFMNNLDKFDININKQVEKLETLKNKETSFKNIANNLFINSDGILTSDKSLKLRSFARKLLDSKTDKLDNLSSNQIQLLDNSTLFREERFDSIDIDLPTYTAFNCWTEIFRSYDSSVIKRETNKFLNLVS